MPNIIFRTVCGAKLRGKPSYYCQRPPLVSKTRCALHGGASPTGPRDAPRHLDARKPGLKPRDPLVAKRRKLRAHLLRTDPDLATAVPPFAVPATRSSRALAREAAQLPAPNARPPWPRNGYAGGPDVRALEKNERRLIRELHEAPFTPSR